MRHVAQEFTRGLGQQAVADAHLLLGGDHVDGGGNDGALVLALAGPDHLDAFAAHQQGLAKVHGFIAQEGVGQRVLDGPRVAEDAIVIVTAGDLLLERRGGQAPGVGTVAAGDEHAVLGRGHDPRGLQQRGLVDDHGLGQERLDQVRLQGGDRGVGQRLDARARRDADRVGRRRGAVRPQAQQGTPVDLFQHQVLARVDAVRVAHLLQVHAPEFRPAPGGLEEQPGNRPQRIAALDGVLIRRVRGQLRQRHARLRHLLGRRPLARGDRVVLGPGRRAHQDGDGDRERCPGMLGNGFGRGRHRIFAVLVHCGLRLPAW